MVKSLRLVSYEFTFHGIGGEPYRVGFDGPWDVKRILGTVPVEADGSAHFHVPASTPVAVQPLDAEGKALALMRSWYTAMPGEVVSCIGCHEQQNTAPPLGATPLAAKRQPSEIRPWYGPARGFSFVREVQPVLDAYCIDCHHGSKKGSGTVAGTARRVLRTTVPDPFLDPTRKTFDLTARPPERVASAFQMNFEPSYMELHRFVHTPTLESDAHLLPPRDFHADTSKLIQILRDDHYGVRLSAEAWDRLITWIDLNAPAHGTWREVVSHLPDKAVLADQGAVRRRELHRRYSGIDEDPEAIYPTAVLTDDQSRERDHADATERPRQFRPSIETCERHRALRKQRATSSRSYPMNKTERCESNSPKERRWNWSTFAPASSPWDQSTATPTSDPLIWSPSTRPSGSRGWRSAIDSMPVSTATTTVAWRPANSTSSAITNAVII